MKIFNRYNLVVATMFILGFIFILLNSVLEIFSFVALCLFFVASVLLSIPLFENAKVKFDYDNSLNEEIIMERNLEGENEFSVKKEKKQRRYSIFKDKIRPYLPAIISVLFALLLLFAIVTSIIKMVK